MNQRVSTITALRTWLETAKPDDRAAVSREGVATLLGDWDELTAERDRLRAALHELVEAGDMISTGTSTDRDPL